MTCSFGKYTTFASKMMSLRPAVWGGVKENTQARSQHELHRNGKSRRRLPRGLTVVVLKIEHLGSDVKKDDLNFKSGGLFFFQDRRIRV